MRSRSQSTKILSPFLRKTFLPRDKIEHILSVLFIAPLQFISKMFDNLYREYQQTQKRIRLLEEMIEDLMATIAAFKKN